MEDLDVAHALLSSLIDPSIKPLLSVGGISAKLPCLGNMEVSESRWKLILDTANCRTRRHLRVRVSPKWPSAQVETNKWVCVCVCQNEGHPKPGGFKPFCFPCQKPSTYRIPTSTHLARSRALAESALPGFLDPLGAIWPADAPLRLVLAQGWILLHSFQASFLSKTGSVSNLGF